MSDEFGYAVGRDEESIYAEETGFATREEAEAAGRAVAQGYSCGFFTFLVDRPTASRFGPSGSHVIEQMGEDASGDCSSDLVDDWLRAVTTEEEDALGAAIDVAIEAWATANGRQPTFYLFKRTEWHSAPKVQP